MILNIFSKFHRIFFQRVICISPVFQPYIFFLLLGKTKQFMIQSGKAKTTTLNINS